MTWSSSTKVSRARPLRLVCLVLVTAAAACAAPVAALAHLYDDSDGLWTFRYFTRHQAADVTPSWCQFDDSQYWEDPINVIFWAYGEGYRMSSHTYTDANWQTTGGSSQVICGNSGEGPGGAGHYDYGYSRLVEIEQRSPNGCQSCTRSHFRIWVAPHGHGDPFAKWSAVGVHHETWTGSTHVIDASWEDQEWNLGAQMSGSHYFAYDYWTRRGGTIWKNHWDDGITTRVGGEHNNVYP